MHRPVQLSLDELPDARAHRLLAVWATDTGYRPECWCGRVGDEHTSKAAARADNLSHVARTPYGRAVRATLAR